MSTPLPPPPGPARTSNWARPSPVSAPLPPPPFSLSLPVRFYRSSRRLATVLRWLLLACMLVAGADAAANAAAYRLIDRLQADANLVGLAQIEASDQRTVVMTGVFAVAFLIAVGFLIAWTSRVYRNLGPLGVQELRFTEGWAVGAWFVPFLNLVRPKQILDDVWRATGPDRGDDDWHQRKVTPLLHVWWGLWILGGLLSLSSADNADLSSAKSSSIAACVADGVLIVACALAIVVVTRLTESQELRATGNAPKRSAAWEHAVWLGPILATAVFGFAFAGFAAADNGSADGEGRSDAPEDEEASRDSVLALDLALGDCFDDPPAWSDATEEITTVLAVNVVPCSESHDEEVVGQVRHPADPDADFPGDEAMIAHADMECMEAFEQWVGRAYSESSLELGYLWPVEENWDVGDRTILCLAFRPGGQPLTGTVRDTAM